MAREYLARRIANPLHAAAELARFRAAAQRLIRSGWARQRIDVLADALQRHGTLTGEQILEMSSLRKKMTIRHLVEQLDGRASLTQKVLRVEL